jgi:hypothetical protein
MPGTITVDVIDVIDAGEIPELSLLFVTAISYMFLLYQGSYKSKLRWVHYCLQEKSR